MKLLKKENKIEPRKGFTLIELVVVMAVFLFIIGAAIGIFISVIQNQKKVLAEQQLINQISYVEEYMSKSLRMATTDTTGLACFGDTKYAGYIYLLTHYNSGMGAFTGIKFLNQSNGVCQEFVWDTTSSNGINVLQDIKNSATAVPLTSSALQINYIKFSIDGSGGSTFAEPSTKNTCTSSQCGAAYTDTIQPRVTIIFNIKVAGDSQEPVRTIQTTVSQRNLNVNNGQR
jgi:prepilin-type N-terminal cleavage/methylation domain-containing protein